MPTSVITGATVTFTFGTTTLKIASLSVTSGQGTFDVSAFGTLTYIHRIGGGLKDLAGSASGFLTTGATTNNPFAIVDNQGTMLITYLTGCTVSFPAIVGAVSVDISRSGVGVLRFDWSIADGADPTIAWL